MSAKCSTNNHS